jgi:predicted RNA-binding protein YlqC (UPF0109 family)
LRRYFPEIQKGRWQETERLSGVLRKPVFYKFRLGNLIFSEPDLFYSFGLVEVTMLKELIELIAKALVDHPEQVEVSELEGEQTSVIELRVAKEDLGKVIGKQGRTARAMRTILSAASTKIRKRAVLEIIE